MLETSLVNIWILNECVCIPELHAVHCTLHNCDRTGADVPYYIRCKCLTWPNIYRKLVVWMRFTRMSHRTDIDYLGVLISILWMVYHYIGMLKRLVYHVHVMKMGIFRFTHLHWSFGIADFESEFLRPFYEFMDYNVR